MSAWGSSWGSSWLSAWGQIGEPVEQPIAGAGNTYIEDEEELLLFAKVIINLIENEYE